MNIPLDEVIYFDCITSTPSTGAAVDADSTPTFAVYEEATDTDIGVGGNLTKRTSLTGNYRGTFTLSAANGFEVGKWYNVIGSAVVGGVTGKAVLKNFRVVAAEAIAGKAKVDVDAALGTAVTLDANNVLNVSTKYWAGTAITATSIPVATAAGAAGGLMIAGSNAATTFATLTVSGATTLTGNVSLGGTLGVTGTVTLDALTVSNATTLSGAVNLGSTLTVTGTTTLAALAMTTLTASGAVAFQSTFAVTAAFTATNASNDIRGVALHATQAAYAPATAAALATAQTSIDDIPTNAELATALAAADDAVLAAIAALNNLSSAGAASAVTTALTTALTEGYRSANATGSVRDLLYEIIAHLGESAISGTTKTLKKIDGSTSAKTYTLNSSSAPTAITETT